MYFGFDDDQLAFRDAVRDLLDKHCPPEVVRAAWDAPAGSLDRGVWDQLGEMGVLGFRELGLDERSLALILEETGRAALPHPIVDTYVANSVLAAEHRPDHPEESPDETMAASNLAGPNVACAADADFMLLRDGGALYRAEPGTVRLVALDTVDHARRAARVEWDPADATLVAADPAVVELAFDRGAWATAAQLVGLGQRMLDMTVAYVTQREQFGQAIGAFQAVKHHLADALKELAFARPAVHRAAHTLAVGSDDVAIRQRDVSMAKAMASDAARFVGRQALQCHGAIGYTVEADLHLYLKRAWALATAWGDATWHRDRVGAALGI